MLPDEDMPAISLEVAVELLEGIPAVVGGWVEFNVLGAIGGGTVDVTTGLWTGGGTIAAGAVEKINN